MPDKLKLYFIPFLFFPVLSFGQVIDSTKSLNGEIQFKIIRETEEQSKRRLLKLLSDKQEINTVPVKKEAKDINIFDKPMTDLITPDEIKTVFVPYIKSDSIALSDENILTLLVKSKLISQEKMHDFHLAPWIILTLTTVDDKIIYMELMMDKHRGFLILEDGQTYGFILNK